MKVAEEWCDEVFFLVALLRGRDADPSATRTQHKTFHKAN